MLLSFLVTIMLRGSSALTAPRAAIDFQAFGKPPEAADGISGRTADADVAPEAVSGVGLMKKAAGIRAKILSGFVAILFVLALVAAIGTLQSLKTGAVVGESAARHAEAAAVSRIDRDLASVRRNVTNFAYSGDASMAAAPRQDMAAAQADVQSARAILSGARAAKLDELAAALGDYAKLYESIVELKASQAKLRTEHVDPDDARYTALADQLRLGVAKSDDDDAKEAGNVLVEQGLLARYNLASMLERRDTEFGAKADENFLKVENALGAITNAVIDANLVPQFKEFTKLETDYRKSVSQLMALAARVNEAVASDLPALGDRVSKTIQALVESADQDAASLQETATATASNTARLMAMIGVGGVLAGVALALALGSRIARPILGMTEAMRRLAAGELDLQIPSVGRGDEIGSMAKAVEVFRDNAAEMRRLQGEANKVHAANEARLKQLEAHYVEAARAQTDVVAAMGAGLKDLAGGDLTVRLGQGFTPTYAQIRDDFNEAIDRLRTTVVSVVESAGAIRTGAQEISSASDDLSRRTEQQAASLEQTTATLGEVTTTVKQSAEGTSHARQVVTAADNDAKQSAVVVREAVDAMSAIAKSSREISQIIGVIDEIAFQTNLLALNAGVEAARAGDAGLGFAVVASEVRALAQRSAEAAKQIKALISDSTGQVDKGVKLVAETGRSLERIMEQVTEINVVVSHIAAGTQEQSTALQEINTAIDQMNLVVQQNAAMVEESTAAGHSLSDESSRLAQLVGQFRVQRSASERPMARAA